jgi:transposase
MKNLNRRTFTCAECGQVEGRDRNAARNVYWYGEERRNRVCEDTARGETGEQGHVLGFVPVPIAETRIETHGGCHESQ